MSCKSSKSDASLDRSFTRDGLGNDSVCHRVPLTVPRIEAVFLDVGETILDETPGVRHLD